MLLVVVGNQVNPFFPRLPCQGQLGRLFNRTRGMTLIPQAIGFNYDRVGEGRSSGWCGAHRSARLSVRVS